MLFGRQLKHALRHQAMFTHHVIVAWTVRRFQFEISLSLFHRQLIMHAESPHALPLGHLVTADPANCLRSTNFILRLDKKHLVPFGLANEILDVLVEPRGLAA